MARWIVLLLVIALIESSRSFSGSPVVAMLALFLALLAFNHLFLGQSRSSQSPSRPRAARDGFMTK